MDADDDSATAAARRTSSLFAKHSLVLCSFTSNGTPSALDSIPTWTATSPPVHTTP